MKNNVKVDVVWRVIQIVDILASIGLKKIAFFGNCPTKTAFQSEDLKSRPFCSA